jgi:hypothetical protein
VFLVELVSFMIIWPLVWWLGGRLSKDGLDPVDTGSKRRILPENVIDLDQFRRRHQRAGRRGQGPSSR